MTISASAICSSALLMLGAKPINDFSEDNDRTRLVSNLYEQSRREVIRQHTWNSCIKRVVLSPEATKDAFGYYYTFVLPPDFIKAVSVNDRCEYLLENGRILYPYTDVNLAYVADNEDFGSWAADMVALLILTIAQKCAYAITGSASLAATLDQQLSAARKMARSSDGQDEPSQTIGRENLYWAGF